MEFLSIKDSVNHTSRSESTIRRLVKEIQSSVKNKQELSKKIKFDYAENGSKKILLSLDFLNEYYGLKKEVDSQMSSQNPPNDQPPPPQSNEFIDFLKTQIEQKDLQINSLTNQIADLIERQKESNILLLESKSLRQIEQETRKKKWWQRRS
jgi:hypothetical protein